MTFPAISLDIETLSTHKNAVVASIGACRVTRDGLVEHTESDFYVRLDLQSQIDAGRHVSEDTIKFWLMQNPDTSVSTFKGPSLKPVQAIEELRKYIQESEFDGVWTKGPAFDGAILESLAEQNYVEPAWHFRQHRDFRTIDTIVQWSADAALQDRWYEAQQEMSASNSAAHNALEDAKAQGRLIAWFMKEIRND